MDKTGDASTLYSKIVKCLKHILMVAARLDAYLFFFYIRFNGNYVLSHWIELYDIRCQRSSRYMFAFPDRVYLAESVVKQKKIDPKPNAPQV